METFASGLRDTKNQEECLHRAYDFLVSRYHGDRIKTYTRFWKLFDRDPQRLAIKTWFLHCTNLNILLRDLLIQSGKFTREDIRFRWTQIWYISPHQYAQVQVNHEWIDIDIWAHRYRIPFGDHAHGLH